MKKLIYLIVLALVFSLVLVGCNLLSHVGQVPPSGQDGSIDIVKDTVPYKTNLIAGKHTIAGNVTVTNDGDNLYITYHTSDSWLLNETHLYVGQTEPSKSAPGQFPYKHENLEGASTDPYVIPLVDLWVGFSDTVYIAAQADLIKEEQEESGWAEGTRISSGKNWAMYFEYQLSWDKFSDYKKIAIMTDRAIHEFVENCEIYGEEQAKQMIIDFLLGKEGVINAGIGIDNESIWFQWENGMTSSFSEYPELEEQQKGYSRSFNDQKILTYSKDARNTPENNNAIIFDWEHTEESTDKVRMIEEFLKDKGYVPTYRSRSESTFTLYELENINDYGVIYIDSHAFADEVHGVKILTGQEGMPFTPEYDEVCAYFKGKYGTDNFISTHSFYKKKWGGLVEEYIGRFYCFYPGFIEAIASIKSFPNSLAYADACYSYADPSMAAAFTDSGGAYAYCGYGGTTYAECSTDYLTFQYLLVDGMDLEAAIDKAYLNTNLPILCWGLHFYPEDHGDLYLVNGGTGPVHNLTKNTYYNTIQAALDDADSDNIIEVSEGTYNENINFNGKNITLRSTNPNDPDVVASTVIDGGGNGSVVIFAGGETRQAVLKGLTIQNGNSEPGAGGGIMINNSSPTISGNIIRWNKTHIDHGGGGIFLAHSASPLIEDNTIDGNQGGFGGGIYVGYNSSPTIRNNSIENNLAEIHRGGGIFISGSSSPIIQDNSFSDNSSQYGGGICIVENSSGEISNNYFAQNTAQYGGGIFCGEDSDPIIKENEFSENIATGFGGGLFIGECVVNNNVISGNTAQTGGGIFVWESSPTISDNTISGNTTTMSGGGIYLRSNSHPTINNNIISLNTTTRDGGGLYIDGSSSVKTTNGSAWPRQNTPPNTEDTNTYSDNTHGNPLDYTEGADVYFLNPIVPPQDVLTVSTKGTDYIDKTSVGVVGTIHKIGGANVDEVGFEYEDLTDSIHFPSVSHSVDLSSPGEFSDDLTNLESGHQYKFKFYAHNPIDGRKEGDWIEFTTNEGTINGQITDISPLTNPFILDTWYTTNAYVKNTGDAIDTFKVVASEPSGTDFEITQKSLTLNAGASSSASFKYQFNGTETCRTLTFKLYDSSNNLLKTYTTGSLCPEPTTVSAPTGVDATDGTYTDKVKITWNSVSGATHYKVYRARASNDTKVALTGWQTSPSYDDTSADFCWFYCYWVKAATSSSGANASDYSDYNTGWRRLEAPQNVTASIGEVGKTTISWDPVESAVYYRVYRGLSTGSKIPISDWFQTATYQYNDYTGEVNKIYLYWVKAAYNTGGLMESDWSDPVMGYRK